MKKKKLKLYLSLALAIILISAALFSEQLAPYDALLQNDAISLQAPSAQHIMGTDIHGRDLFSRVLVGGRVSIFSSLALVAIICVFGTLVGTVGGMTGGVIDTVLMRISDICLAFPGLVFAMAVAALLQKGIFGAVFALAMISWPKYARLARSQTLALKKEPFVQAAILSGDSSFALIFRHLLPNMLGPILVTAMLDIGTMMMELAGLSFLGLGAQPPVAEWGNMMSGGRSMLLTYPWIVLSPGFAIFISVTVFNLLGDAVRDALDPKSKN